MKKIFYLLLLAVLALCICTPALATSGTTTLTTTVPSHFDLNVTIIGNGTIEINGKKLSETDVVSIERNKEVTIKITPKAGYYTNSVIYDGVDITSELVNGALSLSHPEHEASIIVKFTVETDIPNTGDHVNPPLIFYVTAITSLMGIVVLLTASRKRSNY